MKIAEIHFLTRKYGIVIEEKIENLLFAMIHLGRIVGMPSSLVQNEESFVVTCRIPEDTSLDGIEENHWHSALLDDDVGIRSVVMGKDVWGQDNCGCIRPAYYILAGSKGIPLKCGACGLSVPLYRIPFTYDADPSFYDVHVWNKENLAWSEIEFLSAKEKDAHHQLCDLGSELSRAALEICASIESRTGKPCYYYLENLREAQSVEDELSRGCQRCGGDWRLWQTLHESYDYKCDECRILSNFSHDVRDKCRVLRTTSQ